MYQLHLCRFGLQLTTCVCVCVCVRACTSPGKMPTVVSPELYRARFCEAMDKYFLMVPDHWNGLGINC